MKSPTIILIATPFAALSACLVLAAAGLPALAVVAATVMLLLAYAFVLVRLATAERRVREMTEAAEAGAAVSRARRLAILDPTCDLLARWYFELRVEEEAMRSLRYEEPMTVVVLQPPPDMRSATFAAQEAASAALRTVRKTDLVGSLEEGLGFCFIRCDRAHAELIIGRLAARLGPGWQAGLAVVPDDEESGKQALQRASDRLQLATPFAA